MIYIKGLFIVFIVLYAHITPLSNIISLPGVQNYCVRGLELFAAYLFQDILELYDWNLRGRTSKTRRRTSHNT